MANENTRRAMATGTGPGKGQDSGKANKLMSTEASDAKDTMTGVNELKQFVGGSGKPPVLYGVAARKF